MNLSQQEIKTQMVDVLKSFKDEKFRIRDVLSNKTVSASNGSINKYIEEFISHGCIRVLSGEKGKTKQPRILQVVQLNNLPSFKKEKKKIDDNAQYNKDYVRELVNTFIKNNPTKKFCSNDILNLSENKNITRHTVNLVLSEDCKKQKLIRVSRGLYKKIKKVLTTSERFIDENGTTRHFLTTIHYKKVSKYLNNNIVVLSGPNVKMRVRTSKIITKDAYKLYLVDNDLNIINEILTKCSEYKNYITPLLCNIADLGLNTQFQDMDFCSTWIHKDSEKRESGEILANRLLYQSNIGWNVAAMNFTFCIRTFKKPEVIRFLNSIFHIVGASLKSFDSSPDEYDLGEPLPGIKSGYAYSHTPNWFMKGRIIDFDFFTYTDSGTPMFSCLIVYK